MRAPLSWVFDDAVADEAGHGDADGCDIGVLAADAEDELGYSFDEGFGGEFDKRGFVLFALGEGVDIALNLMVDDQSCDDPFRKYDAYGLCHFSRLFLVKRLLPGTSGAKAPILVDV
jgi:hypothetical protein